MSSVFFSILKRVYHTFPTLQPVMNKVYQRNFRYKTRFDGWGMTTAHQLPWDDLQDWQNFNDICSYVRNNFDFGNNTTGVQKYNVNDLMWRHWIISFSSRYAKKFVNTTNHNFVECGVGVGISSFFILHEFFNNESQKNLNFHLYDSWSAMKSNFLTPTESYMDGKYSALNIETTKKNLQVYENNIIYHQGYIPESFHSKPTFPDLISFLHIDLNSVNATKDALEFFYPKLLNNGLILFDDYGWIEFIETKNFIDLFFKDKPGLLFKLPTGQAIYFHKPN